MRRDPLPGRLHVRKRRDLLLEALRDHAHLFEPSWLGFGAVRPRGVYETVVYATDLEAAAAFYRHVLGLREVDDGAFRLADGAMLLLFDPERSSQPGRPVPSHGASGSGHVAFSVATLEGWRERLRDAGVDLWPS